jgi:excisionase family DNA binding protein
MPNFQHTKPRYPVKEAFDMLGLSNATGYRRVREGLLRIVKDGARSFITAAELERYLAACEGQP